MPNAPDPIKAQSIADSKQKADDLINSHHAFARAVKHLNAQTERPVTTPRAPFDPLENESA